MLKKIFFTLTPMLLWTAPNNPSDLQLNAISGTSISLSWQDNSIDERGFKIYRDSSLIGITQEGVNTYMDRGLTPRTEYTYTVRATDDTKNYEDAEDNNVIGWDPYSGGGSVSNVYDATKVSRVIELQGDGVNSAYMLGNYSGSSGDWANTSDTNIQWSMNYSEDFTVYVLVTTANGGISYLYYRPQEEDSQAASGNILHGLGVEAKDGSWHTFTRDLTADLKDFEPDNEIVMVHGIILRGSGKIDDIWTTDTSELAPIFIIGASTVNYEKMDFRLQGWGQKIDQYMKKPTYAYNRARAGSVAGTIDPDPNNRSYNAPGSPEHSDNDWVKTKAEIMATDTSNGGFLLIQFGSNESHIDLPLAEYRTNIHYYVDEARLLGLTPVLVTVPAARSGLNGNFGRDPDYINQKIGLANDENVLLLNIYESLKSIFTGSTLERLGNQYGKYTHTHNGGLYNWADRGHTEQRGAFLVAGEIRDTTCDGSIDRTPIQQEDAEKLCAQFDLSVEKVAENFYSTAQYVDDSTTDNAITIDNKMDGWRVLDHDELVYDLVLRVNGEGVDEVTGIPDMDIHLNGNERDYFFVHGATLQEDTNSWNNTTQTKIKWDMNFDNIQVYIWLETQEGSRLFYYDQDDEDRGIKPSNPSSIRFGLGSDSVGSWHTFIRDLNADLKKFEPNNSITVVKGMGVYGNGLIDNLKMF